MNNRTMPAAAVFPVLVYDDVPSASQWLCDTFGFALLWHAGEHRAVLVLGDGGVMLGEARDAAPTELGAPATFAGPRSGPVAHSVMVRVEDVDRHYEHALALGADVSGPPRDFPYGERQYNATDIGGHHWTFSQSIADVAPEEWGGTSGLTTGA
ncbi:MAG TPA: VOC family protein [Solirubrobacteraceae bacterium]